jgi:hypothetical protein
MFIGIFIFLFWGNRKEASYQSNAVIGDVMLNVGMWVHVSIGLLIGLET